MIRTTFFGFAAALISAANVLCVQNVRASFEDVLLWKSVYDSPAHQDDKALGVAVDAGGGVYVAGFETRGDIGEDKNVRVAKYGPDGSLIWARTYSGGPGTPDAAYAVTVDFEGSVYAAGTIYSTFSVTGTLDGWLAKFSPAGTEYWTRTYGGAVFAEQGFYAVAADTVGNVYAAGIEYRDDLGESGNLLLVKYDSTGTTLWAQSYDSGVSFLDKALGVAVGPAGEVVVAGRSNLNLAGTNSAAVLRKYSADGTFVWGTTFGASGVNLGRAVAVDSAGDVYLVGQIYRASPKQELNRWIRKYGSSGTQVLWTREIDWEGLDDSGAACGLYGGQLAVAGYSSQSGVYQGNNMTLEKFSTADGALLSQFSYNAGWALDEAGEGVAIAPDGSAAVSGWETRSDLGEGVNWLVMKFEGTVPVRAGLEEVRVFPAPFRPSAAVGGLLKFSQLPEGSEIDIYTVKGFLVRSIPSRSGRAFWDGRTEKGEEAVPGIYVYSITAPSGRKRGKFVLLR